MVKLSEAEKLVRERYKSAFLFWLEKPELSDKQIVNYLIQNFDIKKGAAYLDVVNIKQIFGDIKNASKEWHRHTVIEMCKKVYAAAMARKDYKAAVAAADKIGKYTKLDKEEADAFPWDDIIPPSWEPSNDPQLLGIKMDPSQEKKLRDKVAKKYFSDVTDIPFEEIPDA